MSKTTLAGVLTILAGAATFLSAIFTGHAVDMGLIGTLVAAVTAGLGLIKAADATP